jgi:hypothetical protein
VTSLIQQHRALFGPALYAYIAWREACVAVQSTYHDWSPTSSDSSLGFKAYEAALDREEVAASQYARCLGDGGLRPRADEGEELRDFPTSFTPWF